MRAWLVFHVLAAIAGLGPEITFGVMGPRGRRRGRVEAATIYDAIDAARKRIVLPALALQFVSGIALYEIAGHSMRERWLAVALGCYTAAIFLVALVLLPGSVRARRALASGADPADPALRGLWKRQAISGGIAGTLLIIVAVLMVAKPSF